MATVELDALGLRCPQPLLKIATILPELKAGDVLAVLADCDSFEEDVRKWCERMGKTLLAVEPRGNNVLCAQIQM